MVSVEPQFTITREGNVSVSFKFRNRQDSTLLPVETLKIRVSSGDIKEYPAQNIISFRADPKKEKNLYMAFSHNNRQYHKYFPIPYPSNASFDVSFFPEGGQLLPETFSRIGFKALNGIGLSEEIVGEIYDSNDQHIVSIQSLHAGMGSFLLFPEEGKTYYALCTNEEDITLRFDLPDVQPNTCVLRAIQRNQQFFIVAEDHRTVKDDLFLVVHLRGALLYAQQMPENNMVALKCMEIPPGLIQVLLLDKEMNPLSERLLFNRPHALAKADITTDKPNYERRDRVKMSIKINLPDGYQKKGSFALSVTDNHDVLPDTSMTITSYLLLSSELKGYIEDANYYLSNHPAAAEALDALMLTQGWRRYDIPSVAQGILEEPDGYIDGGQEFSGMVKELFFPALHCRMLRCGSWLRK